MVGQAEIQRGRIVTGITAQSLLHVRMDYAVQLSARVEVLDLLRSVLQRLGVVELSVRRVW